MSSDHKFPKSAIEVPPTIAELKKEIESLKERVRICEDALKEIWERYQEMSERGSS